MYQFAPARTIPKSKTLTRPPDLVLHPFYGPMESVLAPDPAK
jgi:hypothetical protein